MKHINESKTNDFGKITVKFADRCFEYRSAGIPLRPTVLKTIRVCGCKDYAMPVTSQVLSVKKTNILKDIETIFELN